MDNAELIRHLDAIAFEDGPSPEAKLIRIQNCLYQVDQANTANSIRADEATLEETQLYKGFRR
jgi:hypothetical protein